MATIIATDIADEARDTYIQKTLEQLPADPAMRQFATLFLSSLSLRTLELYSFIELSEFVADRYLFFKAAVKKNGAFRIYKPTNAQPWLRHKYVIDMVNPDAPNLLFTLETLLRDFGVKISRKLHPIMGVTVSPTGEVTQVQSSREGKQLFSVVYVEFDELENPALVDALSQRIADHMRAVQTVNLDQKNLRKKATDIKEQITKNKRLSKRQKEDWAELFSWLQHDNFSFFGYISFSSDHKDHARPDKDSGLGVLSVAYLEADRSFLLETLTSRSWKLANYSPFVFESIPVPSPVQRFDDLLWLRVRFETSADHFIEHHFVGLLRRASLGARNLETPIIKSKITTVLERKNILKESYDFVIAMRLFNAMPKHELFLLSEADLLWLADNLFSITNPNNVYCFHHLLADRKLLQMVVILPTALFTQYNKRLISEYMFKKVPHFRGEIIEVNGDEMSRLHFYFEMDSDGSWLPQDRLMADEVRQLVRPWEERVRDILGEEFPGRVSDALFTRYVPSMPNHYRVRTSPQDAVGDMQAFERVAKDGRVQVSIRPFETKTSEYFGRVSVLTIYSAAKIDLIQIMPVLGNLGLYVIDQLTARIGLPAKTIGYIQTFRVTDKTKARIDNTPYQTQIADLIVRVMEGRAEDDPLNQLVVMAGLGWQPIQVLQTYRNYYAQLVGSGVRSKVNQALCQNPAAAQVLVRYFESKFSPEPRLGNVEYRRSSLLPKIRRKFVDVLQAVGDVQDDVVLRDLFELMAATLRSNYYVPRAEGSTAIAIKVDPAKVKFAPSPVPYREIYVHDVGVEAVHLRFGPVSRGGLRWSNRPDDFRREVLGLVKTQQVKNVVIVPQGSKGGFVVKSGNVDQVEGRRQYSRFIGAMLSVTDNLDETGQPRHPDQVLSYDRLDPYLVVAADKGTATFSDLANSVSEANGFWLGDAFASGGSNGYDHKKVGITARGAWECVRLHFAKRHIDIQKEPISVVGVGDMSGDVFGNGMLLSHAIRLRAAFNHIHVFLDPAPDPEISWKERKRLFDLPSSTWKDYSPDLISAGGGVFDRKAKEIHLSSEAKKMLGTTKSVVTGDGLIKLILKMETDLIWLGGIGTYMKSKTQTHLEVGDPANDDVRIDAEDCRANVIGEGANLGLTQKARIDFDLAGGQLNTDAIDNSAGVNLSDYEVNIKILLQRLIQNGQIKSMADRNALLASLTQEVAELVLRNNRAQHGLLTMDSARSATQGFLFWKLIHGYISSGQLNPETESIPDRDFFEGLIDAEKPIPRPILAVLQAYVKMDVRARLVASDWIRGPELEAYCLHYFPAALQSKYKTAIAFHLLKIDIIAMSITNHIINNAGIYFFARMEEITAAHPDAIAAAYLKAEKQSKAVQKRAQIGQDTTQLLRLEQDLAVRVLQLLTGTKGQADVLAKCVAAPVSGPRDAGRLTDQIQALLNLHR